MLEGGCGTAGANGGMGVVLIFICRLRARTQRLGMCGFQRVLDVGDGVWELLVGGYTSVYPLHLALVT